MSEAKSMEDEAGGPDSALGPNSVASPDSERGPESSGAPDSMSFSEAEAASERRLDYRHLASFPAQLHTKEGVTRTALIRDLSISGALLLTRARFEVGDPIKLSLHLVEETEPTLVDCTVVRFARRTGELAHPWTKSVAVRFDRTVTELEPTVKALAEKQAALFVKKT